MLVCAAALALAGCAPKAYRVAGNGGLYFLYPPGHKAPRGEPLPPVRLPLDRGQACRVAGKALALERGVVTARLQSVIGSSYNQEALRDSWEEFRAGLGKLEEEGCLRPGDARSILEQVAERVPNLAQETIYFRYGFNRWRSYLDLQPGLVINVQWALARGGEPAGADLQDLNVGMRRYRVTPREASSGIRLVRGEESVTAGEVPREGVPELERAGMPHYRLFFLTKFLKIAGQPERSAALVGVPRMQDLRETTARFLEDADAACQGKFASPPPDCIAVDRRISFVPEVGVEVNGRAEFVNLGTDLATVLRAHKAPGAFTLERLCGSRYCQVLFPAGDPNALRVPLLAGDRVRFQQDRAGAH